MHKKFILLFALFFPALVQSAPLSEPASLRETIPLDAIGYLRIPSPWGVFTTPKGSLLAGALAHEQHVQQIQNVEASVYQNILKPLEALTHPGLTFVFHHLRSPVEAVVLLPQNAPPPLANILISAKLNFTSIEEVNNFLKKVVAKTPPLMITSEVSAEGYGALMAEPVPVFLHYDVNTQTLKLMGGMMANEALFRQTLSRLVPVKQHPMYALENWIDTSHQGLFQWVNLQRILPLVFGMIPPQVAQDLVPDLNKWGLLDIRGAALGWGVRDGKGRLSVMIDAPRTGYRKFFPAISNNFSVTASGKPGTVASLSIPALGWLKGFEKILKKEAAPEELQDYRQFKEMFKQEFGFSIKNALQALGPEILFFTDEVGEFVAVRVGNKKRWHKVLTTLVKKYGLAYETRQINGKEYHHLAMSWLFLEDTPPANSEDEAFLMELVSKFNDHYYWVEEEGYLIFAAIPQMLLDRQRHLARVSIQQWLKLKQRQDTQSSLFAVSTTVSKTPRRLYYAYLQMLNMVADLADAKIDMFALPTATEVNLSKIDGTYGLQLDLADSGLALELTFENNPLEFMLDPGVGGMIVMGILASIAIPAYTDYLKQVEEMSVLEEEAEAWNEIVPEKEAVPENEVEYALALLHNFQTLAEEYSSIFGRFPETEEIEEIWGPTNDESIDIRLLDTKDGYSAEFKNPAISGKLIILYDADSMTWTCTHEGLSEEDLPDECLQTTAK